MALWITIVDIPIPIISGRAKHRTFKKLATPADSDSAIKGKTNDASIAIAHMPAFVPISFLFCEDVMIAFLIPVSK